MSELPCFHARKGRKKGCKKPAEYRVLLGNGLVINVCALHVESYKGLGFKIIKLEEVKQEAKP
jgi:hypothetical protein